MPAPSCRRAPSRRRVPSRGRRDRSTVLLGAVLLLGGLSPLIAGCSSPAKEDSPGSQPPAASTLAASTVAASTSGTPTAVATAKPGSAAVPAEAPAEAPAPEPTAKSSAAAQGGLSPLDAGQRATLLAGDEDDPLAVDTHYIQSNETRHDLYFPYIDGIGGAFIGVGSDQSFTLAATAKSELMFMMDIDTRVVELQKMYAVLVPAADSAEALVDAFHESNVETTVTTLTEAFSDMPESQRTKLIKGFRTGRETVYRHLQRVIARTVDGEPATWLSSPEKFAHIQALYRTGRVRMMVGNLAGDRTMRTVGKVCKDLGVPVGVLYMSNAEEYFKYTDDFRANIDSLPIDDEHGVVLRTIYSKKWVHADLWAYQVQPLADFRTRLADKINRSRNPMLRLAENADALTREAGPKGLSLVALPSRS